LLFEDGTVFEGELYLGEQPAVGEAVFNTTHSGYQEVLTDPSYFRQIVVFTAPHIGNVGVCPEDDESEKVHVAAAVVRSLSPRPSSWRAREDVPTWLQARGAPLLVGADTRAITLHVRTRGAMRAGVFPAEMSRGEALESVLASPSMADADLASEVTSATPSVYDPRSSDEAHGPPGDRPHVAVLDFGVKRSILRELHMRGCIVTVLPARTPASVIREGGYNGLLASNGPGDPAATVYGIETLRDLLEAGLPIFGICLGHQLLALAAGGRTYKLPFGHRGANHPVRRLADGAIEVTSQNHGFAVSPDDVGQGFEVSHVNLNDGTIEGLEHRELPIFSIQYHPEASPGPHEGRVSFDRFVMEMRRA
jgi:carbamoyl-phosphate synthase small subunit